MSSPETKDHPLYLDHRKPFMVRVVVRHPHFDDTGFDTEVLESARLMWAYSATEMIEIARQSLIPPQFDPALVSVIVDPVIGDDDQVEG
jgi:hypothetical protein